MPGVTYFKPAGIPLRSLEEIRLSVEEAEALRLKDLEGLEQEQGAEKMNISRPTFQRVLALARKKMADALLNGKAIRIEGGNFEIAYRRFRCRSGHEWEVEAPPAFLLLSVQHVAHLMFSRPYRQDLAMVGGGEVGITRGGLVPYENY